MREAKSLLVCHSDEAVLTFLADNLSADRYAVQTATAVKEARLKLDRICPDLVLCGALAERTDQLELLRWVRDGLSHAARPFVCLAPAGDELATLRLFGAGADDVVGEPFPTTRCSPGSGRDSCAVTPRRRWRSARCRSIRAPARPVSAATRSL